MKNPVKSSRQPMRLFARVYKKTTLLIIPVILQSCVSIYKSSTATLEEAIQSNKKVRVTMVDNRKFYFSRIVIEDDKIYGVKNGYKGKEILISFRRDQISEIHLLNNGASAQVSGILSVGMPITIIYADYTDKW